ncbi:MAG: biosynthetic-type acetolactate synthase large subunit [Oscillospiraceae bacterium]|nr:biosynthetic-type acetolactate synthase large subunit [Oscillospiraceae bacterium]
MKVRATQAIMECLLEQGVDTIFGYPGGTILNIYDELYNYQDRITHILTAHEQGAAHAADGYARATKKVGVCMATSGPGATNLTTGIATAYMDSSPVVFLTVNVGENILGKDSFQEVDITGIAMPITKATYLVRDAEKIPEIMREAFAVASAGRPGPVLIDFLKNVTAPSAMIEYEYLPREEHSHHGRVAELNRIRGWEMKIPTPDRDDIDKLIEMVKESEKPLIICGGGVVRSRADREFRRFAETIDAPVAVTLMGGGGFPGTHPLTTGMIGMHGNHASNIACDQCDLLISVGCRFSDRVALDVATFAPNAKIVHIDIDRAEIDKNVKTDHHIIGDAKQVLELLNAKAQKQDHSAWKEFVFSHKEPECESGTFIPKNIIDTINAAIPDDSIVVTDVGQHQMWSAQYFHFSYPGQLITSGGFGTMGFGLGAAIGAKLGCPDKTVIHTTGDGCFRMNGQEMATVSHYGIPIITVIFNNAVLGMVRQWQNLVYDKRFASTTLGFGPDFVKLANAYDIPGYKCTNLDELKTAIEEAVASGKAAVIECCIDKDEMVHPMVFAGKPMTEFLLD